MSTSISVNFAKQYSPFFVELSQQRTSYFKSKVQVKIVNSAEQWYMDQIGAVEDTEVTTQRQAIVFANTPHKRRQIIKKTFYFADTVEEQDVQNMISDPTAAYTQAGLMALERRLDKLILEAALADAKTGKDGGTTTVFDTGMIVAANSTGLSFAKFLAVRKLFQNRNVAYRKINIAIGPEQEEDLYNIPQFVQREYRREGNMPIDAGEEPMGYVGRFMEFEIWRTTFLALSSTTRKCIAWTEGGLGLAMGIAPKVLLGHREDLVGSPLQVQTLLSAGSSRLDEDKVAEVDCIE